MKRKLPFIYTLFWTLLGGLLFLSNNNNPPNGFTGAPPSGQTCASCHSGGGASGDITISGLPAAINPGQQYPLVITVTRTNATPQKAGFQMTALGSGNAFAGAFSGAGGGAVIQTTGGIGYVEHSPGQNFGGNNTVTFTVNWTAPASGSGNITFYAAANLANGNGSTSGDYIAATTVSGVLGSGGTTLNVAVAGVNASCFGANDGQATANVEGGGGPYLYSWSTGQTTPTIANLAPGSYSVTATDGNGGMGTGSVVITQPSDISVSISNVTQINCNNPIATAAAQASGGTPGYTYNWSNGDTGPQGSFDAPGIYALTVTDAQGCEKTASVNIIGNTNPPAANAGPNRELTCAAATITLNGAGSSTGAGIGYSWSGPGIVSGGNTLTPVVNAAGTYTLTVINQNNGCTSSDNVTVTSLVAPPTANAGPDKELTCASATVALNGAGSSAGAGISYSWSGPGIVSGGNTLTPVVNAAGTYTLTVINQSQLCLATDAVMVGSNTTPPVANAGTDGYISCAAPQDTLSGAGSATGAGISYSWSGPGIVSGGNTLAPVVNAAGTYVLSVSNTANGCSAADTLMVVQNAPLSLSIQPFDASCFGSATGVALAAPAGGDSAYTFLWSNGDTGAAADSLSAGVYTLTLTDGEGCSITAGTTIGQPGALIINVTTTPETAAGAADGTAAATPGGGTPPYTFAWSNGATTSSLANLAPGTYNVAVTDSLGCTAAAQAIVNNSICTGFGLALNVANLSCHNDSSGAIVAVVSGGAPQFSYQWSTGSLASGVSNLAAGAYSVTVSDANNCIISAGVSLSEPQPLTVSTAVVNPACAGEAGGSISVQPLGGTGPFLYAWSTGDSISTLTQLLAGAYGVTVTDSLNCQVAALVELSVAPDTLAPAATCPADLTVATCALAVDYPLPVGVDNCGSPLGSLVAGLPSGSVFPVGETTVTYAFTDGSGNSSQCSFVVRVVNDLQLAGGSALEPSCFGNQDGSLSVSATGGTAPYTYRWDDAAAQTSASATGLGAGTYSVVVTDSVGCSQTLSFVLEQPAPVIAVLDDVSPETNADSNGAIAVSVSGGQGEPYSYLWLFEGAPVAGKEDLSGLASGNYTLIVADANGCEDTLEVVLDRITGGSSLLPPAHRIQVFPNPAADHLTVVAAADEAVSWQLSLLNMSGGLAQAPARVYGRQHTFVLDLSQLSAGVYLLRMVAGDAVVWHKIRVQH